MVDKAIPEGPPQSYGDRVYMVRLELGDGLRNAMTLRDFDDVIESKSGRRIHASELSRIERGERPPIVEDAEAIAKADPRERGPAWLIWGNGNGGRAEKPDASPPQPGPTHPQIVRDDPAELRDAPGRKDRKREERGA